MQRKIWVKKVKTVKFDHAADKLKQQWDLLCRQIIPIVDQKHQEIINDPNHNVDDDLHMLQIRTLLLDVDGRVNEMPFFKGVNEIYVEFWEEVTFIDLTLDDDAEDNQ